MPTLDQLPQAVAADPQDHVLIEKDGVASVTTVAVLLDATQPKLTLAPGVLLGRGGVFAGGPEPVGVGAGLKLTAGVLAADPTQVAATDSPAFTGRPTAPTQPRQDTSDALATTAFVQQHTALASPVKEVAGRTGFVELGVADIAGLSKVAGTGAYADLSGLPVPYTLPTATAARLGGIKAGSGITVAADGTAALTGALPALDASALLAVPAGTGAAGRSLAALAADRLNVLDFAPAANDGASLATTAINAAIAAAALRPAGGEVWLPAGRYRIDTALGSVRARSNVVLRGAGRGRTVLVIDDTNGGGGTNATGGGINNGVPAGTAGAVASPTGGNFAPIDGFQLRDLTLQGLRDTLPSNGVHLTNIYGATNVVVANCEFLSSRMFSLLVAGSTGVSVQDCRVHRSARDSIALWDCSEVVVTGNRISFSGDDSISLHSNDGAVAPVRSGILVANNVISDGQGIAVLGAKMVTIANNLIRRCPVHGIYVAAGPAFRQGDTTLFAVSIQNNTITDVFDSSGWVAGSGSKAYIWLGGPRRSAGTGGSAPGVPAPGTGVVTPLYGSLTGSFYANNQPVTVPSGSNVATAAASAASPGNSWVRVEGNTLVRTLPSVAAWSEWGYGTELPVGNGATYNGPITEAMQQATGIYIEGGLQNSRIAGNTVQTGARRAIEFTVTGLVDLDYDGLLIEGNHVVDFWEFGIFLPSTTSQRIRIERNVFDSDPYFKATNRGPGGTWKTQAPPIGLYLPYVSGVQVIGNHFRNMYSPISTATGAHLILDNVLHCDPVVTGYSPANGGIGNLPPSSPGYVHVIEVADPADANVGRSRGTTLVVSATQPASGIYVAGHFVAAANPSVINGQTLLGWKRLTTGGAHVANTDWVAVYGAGTGAAQLTSPAFIGTPSAPTAAVGTATSQLATTGFVAAALAAPGAIGATTPAAGSFTTLQAGGASANVVAGADANGALALGRAGTTGTPFVEFRGNGLATGYSARLTSDAAGQLSVAAGTGSATLNVVGLLKATTMTMAGANVATQPWVQSQSYVTASSLAGQSPVQAVAGRTGVISLSVADVAGAEAVAARGAALGYAGLDAAGKVPAAQLPIPAAGLVASSGGALVTAATGSGLVLSGSTLSVSGVPLTANNLSEYAAGAAAARGNLGLGSLATQSAAAIAVTGGTISGLGSLSVANATGSGATEGVTLSLSAPAGKTRQWFVQTAGASRWPMGASSAAETGSNAGSDFALSRFSDAGALIDTPLSIQRSTGAVSVAALTIAGAAAATQAYVTSKLPAIPSAGLLGGNGTSLSAVSVAGVLSLSGGVLSSPPVLPVQYTGNASNVAIPSGAQAVLIQLWGPGGGGGGAVRVSPGTAVSGGGGGGGGGYLDRLMAIGSSGGQLPAGSTLNITVPAGGAGGGSSSTATGNPGQAASGPTLVAFSGGGSLAAYAGGGGGAGQSAASSGGGGGGSPGGAGGGGTAGAGGGVATVGGASVGGAGASAASAGASQGGGGGGGGNGSGLAAGAGGASLGGGGAGGGAGGGLTTGNVVTGLGAGGVALPNLTPAATTGAAGAAGQFGSGGSGGAGGASATSGNGLPGGAGGFPGGGGGGGGATTGAINGGNAGGAGGNGLVVLTWFF